MRAIPVLISILLSVGSLKGSSPINKPGKCTGNQEFSSYNEYLTAFRHGPCSPMIWIPGLMGSKLRVKVDCAKMKKARKEDKEAAAVLDKCSFMCWLWSRTYENTLWLSDKGWYHYMLWNDYNFIYKNRDCFFKMLIPRRQKVAVSKDSIKDLIVVETDGTTNQQQNTSQQEDFNRFRYIEEDTYYVDGGKKYPKGNHQTGSPDNQPNNNENGKIDETYKLEKIGIPGLEIRIWGDTDETTKMSKCGANTVQSFMGDEDMQYGVVIENMEEMGYVSGLTMQMVPFDFRLAAHKNEFIEHLRLALRQLKFLTGKRSVIAAHSYGNNVTMNALNTYLQSFKDAHVEEFLAIGAPFMGSKAGLFYLLGVADWMYFQKIKEETHWGWLNGMFDGVNPKYAQLLFPNIDALYEFIPDRGAVEYSYNRFVENRDLILSLGVPQYLVNRVEVSSKSAFTDPSLITYFEEVSEPNSEDQSNDNNVNGDQIRVYYMRDVEKMMERFSINEFTNEYYRQFDITKTRAYLNPGVKTTVFFPDDIGTMAQLRLLSDTREDFKNNKFPKYQIGLGRGDATVNLFSYSMPPMLWMADYAKHTQTSTADGSHNHWGIKRKSLLTPEGVTPKRIRLVQLGRGGPYFKTGSFERVECRDWDKLGPERKRGEKPKPHIKTLMTGWNALIHEAEGVLNNTDKDKLTDLLKNQLNGKGERLLVAEEGESMKHQQEADQIKTERLLSGDNNQFQENNMEAMYNEYPFGTICCNHSMMVVNKQFMEHFKKILSSGGSIVGEDQGDGEKKDVNSGNEDFTQTDFTPLKEDNEAFKKHLLDCPVLRCHQGSDSCFENIRLNLSNFQSA